MCNIVFYLEASKLASLFHGDLSCMEKVFRYLRIPVKQYYCVACRHVYEAFKIQFIVYVNII